MDRSSQKNYQRKALFAISSLGLGHATRSLAVINDFLDRGWAVTIVSFGHALEFLQRELLRTEAAEYIEIPDYPPLERGTGISFYRYLLVDLLKTCKLIRREHRTLRTLEDQYDFIYSDGKYGFYSRHRPCCILTHQIDFMPPKPLRRFARFTEHVNLLALRRFHTILIPDYPDNAINLSGRLSHSQTLTVHNHHFIGILSSYKKLNIPENIDFLFVISGYLVEHKESFLTALLEQARKLPGTKIFILGQKETNLHRSGHLKKDNITIYPMVDGQQRQELFNRAKFIITRAGYTTIMDLVEHDKKGLLIPTPHQTEQEYLAEYLNRKKFFPMTLQSAATDIITPLTKTEGTHPFPAPWKTAQSLQNLREALTPFLQERFFSIIVPAHNEEAYLATTLQGLLRQNYPPGRYEIIVVENGSTDSTFEIAAKTATGRKNIRVARSAKGVSRARNTGLSLILPESEWVLFCDADTTLAPDFLRALNLALSARNEENISIGTCTLKPDRAGKYAKWWFRFFDLAHRLSKTSYALQFAPAPIARKVRFAENLDLAEDLLFIRQCLQYGEFFFFQTNQAATSTRRFDKTGYLPLALRWTLEALLPMRLKKNRRYRVIR